jgi:hypothetical protein
MSDGKLEEYLALCLTGCNRCKPIPLGGSHFLVASSKRCGETKKKIKKWSYFRFFIFNFAECSG